MKGIYMFKYNNFYIIKSSDNKIFHFGYKKNHGIVYKILEKNHMDKSLEEGQGNYFKNYNVAIKDSTEKFSAFLLSGDNICIIYEDKMGNINSNIYDGYKWTNKIIIQNKNKDRFTMYFNGFLYDEQVNIIYNVWDKEKENSTIFHQRFNKHSDFYTTKVIDKINYCNSTFKIFIDNEGEIFIIYPKSGEYHYIGYKIYIKEKEYWSDYYIIDNNDNPFEDYYINVLQNSLQIIYREKNNLNKLIYNIENISSNYNKLNKENKKLKENIDFFQSKIICKEEKINFLENINIEKENKIVILEEEITKLNKYIKDLELKKEEKKNLFKSIFNK